VDWLALQSTIPLMKGIRRVFLCPPSYFGAMAVDEEIVSTCQTVGVKHLVLLSSFEAGLGAGSRIGNSYRRLEERVTGSRLTYTILRASPVMQEFITADPPYPVRNQNLMIPYAEARSAFIDARDIAQVAVKVLTEAGHEGRVYTLTGPEALSLREVTETLAQTTKVPFQYKHTETTSFRQRMQDLSYPDSIIDAATEYYTVCRKGAAAQVFSLVNKITGRPPTPFSQFARDYAKQLSRANT